MSEVKERISWDEYFMRTTHAASERSSCDRAQVGAVIVKNNCPVSQGYNGSIKGMPHCIDEGVGHLMDGGRCIRTIHAEVNAIINASANGASIAGGTIYVTHFPCWNCIKCICNAGLVEVVYDKEYRYKDEVDKMVGLANLPIKFRQYSSIQKG